ncbi:hypothetical protein AVEN_155036-1 [Araneus ventricosus]|uniref:Uncharacterized protein n=1 Tax=Araneus ventricosus TaxID=182803 RepID=A0A4Y2A8I8_ARAVE|nr:hypothetical protein AVEN_155036-1 [Araneus ventricosus]
MGNLSNEEAICVMKFLRCGTKTSHTLTVSSSQFLILSLAGPSILGPLNDKHGRVRTKEGAGGKGEEESRGASPA